MQVHSTSFICSIPRLLLLLMLTGLAACEQPSAPEPSGEVYRVSYAAFVEEGETLERDDVLEGILTANAADPYLDNGDRLEIVYRKQAAPLRQAEEQLQLYAEDSAVSILLLGSGSRIALQLKDRIESLELPTLAVTATHPDVVSEAEFMSQLGFDDQKQARAAALFVRDELLINRVAVVFDENNPHSGYLAQEFRTKFEMTGGRVEGFQLQSDLDVLTLEEWRDRGARFIYMPLSAAGVLDVYAKLDSIGWSPVVMAADGVLATVSREFPNRWIELQGMYVTEFYTHSDDSTYMARFVEDVADAYKQAYGDEVNTLTVLGVEAYYSVLDSVNECPDRSNRSCVNKALRSGEVRLGVMSRYSIQRDGKTQRPIYINRIIDDTLELVVKVN